MSPGEFPPGAECDKEKDLGPQGRDDCTAESRQFVRRGGRDSEEEHKGDSGRDQRTRVGALRLSHDGVDDPWPIQGQKAEQKADQNGGSSHRGRSRDTHRR